MDSPSFLIDQFQQMMQQIRSNERQQMDRGVWDVYDWTENRDQKIRSFFQWIQDQWSHFPLSQQQSWKYFAFQYKKKNTQDELFAYFQKQYKELEIIDTMTIESENNFNK